VGDRAADEGVRRTRLPGGLRVVTERMPGALSVTTGVWVGVGARDEPAALAGASHFLEHLLFKGTAARSAREIAVAVDAVGGEMNAFTAREHTAYYTRLPRGDLGLGLDLLADVLSAPAFREAEVEAERQVILEELSMSEDTPDDRVHTLVYDAVFPDHPLGREVLGDPTTIGSLAREEIRGFFSTHYRPANLVVVGAGDLEHDDVVAAVAERLGGGPSGERPRREAPAAPPRPLTVLRRPTEQAHLTVGVRALAVDDPDRYALAVANHALGDGMSSRLFQEIREERGLAYSVYSYTSAYADSGTLVVYAGTSPTKAKEVLRLVLGMLDDLAADGLTEEELAVAKGGLAGSLLLGLEDSGSRMARLGRQEITRGTVVPVDEHVAALRSVTADDVARVCARVLAGPRAVAAVAPFTERGLAGVA
jgi:predicted Zn-dependent peptidase